MPRKRLPDRDFRTLIAAERAKLAAADDRDDVIMLSISGGAASAVAAHRAIARWGSRVVLVFADTCSEDADLYRFLDDCEAKFGPIVRLRQKNDDGSDMDIWDCFDKHGIMRIPKAGNACKASVELKQKPLDAFADKRDIQVLAIGYGFDEPERMVRMNARKGMTVLYPLVEEPVLSACELLSELERIGLRPPTVYEDGFVHNNCLGAGGCILSGLGQFAAVKRLKPKEFDYARDRSEAFFEKTGFSVLRDQRGGEVKPYTLAQLEADVEAGRDFGQDWQSNCNCMSPLFTADQLAAFQEEKSTDQA